MKDNLWGFGINIWGAGIALLLRAGYCAEGGVGNQRLKCKKQNCGGSFGTFGYLDRARYKYAPFDRLRAGRAGSAQNIAQRRCWLFG